MRCVTDAGQMNCKPICHKENSNRLGHTRSAICIPLIFGTITLVAINPFQNVPFENIDCMK